MKVFHLVAKIFFLLLAIMVLHHYPGCKDPHEYEPGNDSLVPPPPAPQLLYPRDDTTCWYDQWHPYPNDIELGWSNIDDAQYYELELTHDSTFTDLLGDYKVYTYHYTYTITHDGVYYWRVRAYSEHWTWFTDWSETWKFYSWYAP